jgi:REP element-mobilizing transposase RayT
MSYVKIWVHAVWGTKNRYPFLTQRTKPQILEHIKGNAKGKGIFIDTLNGHTEHLHCLMALNADMSIAKAMQLIKGESAFWMNKQNIIPEKFEWADEYFAVSVSESALDKVRAYINNQEEHHKKVSFKEEYDKFMHTYKFQNHG